LFPSKGFFDHKAPSTFLKNTVFLPVEAMIDAIVEKFTEGNKRLGGLYMITYRLRCVLLKQLFNAIELLGIRADVPDYYKRFQLFRWLTKSFLEFKELKRDEGGKKYMTSNIPVVVGLIVHLIKTNVINITMKHKEVFTASGSLKNPVQGDDFHKSIPLTFTLPVFGNQHIFTFDKLICTIIFGCMPFDKGKRGRSHAPTEPSDKFKALMETFNNVTLRTLLRFLKTAEKKSKDEVETVVNVSGYMPDNDYKGLVKRFTEEVDPKEKPTSILAYLKNKELKYLALAANVRFHINYLEHTKGKFENEGDVECDESALTDGEAAVEPKPGKETPLLHALDMCRFLKPNRDDKEPKPNPEDEEVTKVSAVNTFPGFLRGIAHQLQRVNLDLALQSARTDTNYSLHWLYLTQQNFKGDVLKIVRSSAGSVLASPAALVVEYDSEVAAVDAPQEPPIQRKAPPVTSVVIDSCVDQVSIAEVPDEPPMQRKRPPVASVVIDTHIDQESTTEPYKESPNRESQFPDDDESLSEVKTNGSSESSNESDIESSDASPTRDIINQVLLANNTPEHKGTKRKSTKEKADSRPKRLRTSRGIGGKK
jgi:hypothetical protein